MLAIFNGRISFRNLYTLDFSLLLKKNCKNIFLCAYVDRLKMYLCLFTTKYTWWCPRIHEDKNFDKWRQMFCRKCIRILNKYIWNCIYKVVIYCRIFYSSLPIPVGGLVTNQFRTFLLKKLLVLGKIWKPVHLYVYI